MKTMAISRFKATALATIEQVARDQETLVITKRGEPVAQLVPYRGGGTGAAPGKLAQALVFEKDIVSPLGKDLWEAAK